MEARSEEGTRELDQVQVKREKHTHTKEKLRNCGVMVLCCFFYTSYYEIVVISRIFLLLHILYGRKLIAT